MLRGQWDEVVSMDLVHCAVCGEPVYTSRFGETLSEKIDKNVEALCPEHKKTLPLGLWKRVAPGRNQTKGVER
jgi:hypothetical protein